MPKFALVIPDGSPPGFTITTLFIEKKLIPTKTRENECAIYEDKIVWAEDGDIHLYDLSTDQKINVTDDEQEVLMQVLSRAIQYFDEYLGRDRDNKK